MKTSILEVFWYDLTRYRTQIIASRFQQNSHKQRQIITQLYTLF